MPRGLNAPPDTVRGRFGRMFKAGTDPGDDALAALVERIRLLSTAHSANSHIPSGYTYLGQFIDHDVTFDPISQLGRDNDPFALADFRTPRYDLDSLYGTGPDDQPYLYEWSNRDDRGVKLLVGRGSPGDGRAAADLPRNEQGLALVGDPRNDENLIVAQLTLLFIHFHNNVVEFLRAKPSPPTGSALFEAARELVRWHFQWIVTHDFMPLVVGETVARAVFAPAEAAGGAPRIDRRFYSFDDEPFIPVEFSAAAYRFGHTMVRPRYFVKPGKPSVNIFPAKDAEPGLHDLSGGRPLPAELEIDWDLFFFEPPDEDPEPRFRNNSMRIANRISEELFAVPNRGELPLLNLRRGSALRLASGPAVAQRMQQPVLAPGDLQLGSGMPAGVADRLVANTPLWYYLLCEANVRGEDRHLGPIGGRIVAEVLVGLLEGDPQSYLSRDPTWRPTLPGQATGEFTMIDLVNFALGRSPQPPAAPG